MRHHVQILHHLWRAEIANVLMVSSANLCEWTGSRTLPEITSGHPQYQPRKWWKKPNMICFLFNFRDFYQTEECKLKMAVLKICRHCIASLTVKIDIWCCQIWYMVAIDLACCTLKPLRAATSFDIFRYLKIMKRNHDFTNQWKYFHLKLLDGVGKRSHVLFSLWAVRCMEEN